MAPPQTHATRHIGPWGTALRVGGGLALIWLAVTHGSAGVEIDVHDPLLGLLAFPAATILAMWARARSQTDELRAYDGLGYCLNFGIAVALFVVPYTQFAAAWFYGVTLLLTAARGYAGCEILAVSNAVLRRDDQVGCAVFTPIDQAEAGIRA